MSQGTTLTRGARVEVNRGPRLGTQGLVFWTDSGDRYGGGYRVAVKATEELFWIDANALDILGEFAPIHNVIQHRAVHLTTLQGRNPTASPEGRYMLLDQGDGQHVLVDLILSGKELARIEGLAGCRITVSPSGDRLALKAASADALDRWGGAIQIVDLRGRLVAQQAEEHRMATAGDIDFEELVFTADGRCLVHFGELERGVTSALALYSAHDLRPLDRWEGPGRPALEVSLHVDPYHPERLLIYESSSEGQAMLRIFDASFEGGVVERAALPEQGELVVSAGFTERGDLLMVASDAGISAWSWPDLERLWGPREAPREEACPPGTWATLEGGFVRDRFALTVVEEEQERAIGLLLLEPRSFVPVDLLDLPRSAGHAELCLHLGHGRVAICGKDDIEVYLIPALSDEPRG